jgi:3-deoxy-manno-octulosonate cytidylyltransferase (CMP-KDO synthetase)
MKDKVIGVIPSRFASTRLPGKPLVDLCGKPMIQWVYEAACRAITLDEVLVATDDLRVVEACRSFGAVAIMTSEACASGSDRILEALAGQPCDIVVNVQGDEPLIAPETIDRCVSALTADPQADVASAMIRFCSMADMAKPQLVKVVTDRKGYAMYFSRAPIPDVSRLSAEDAGVAGCPGMKHLGLYVYRWNALEQFAALPPSRYEILEKLEQLRFLENGFRIAMVQVNEESIGVDTPEDAERVRELLQGAGERVGG